jgi:hypothetical protein
MYLVKLVHATTEIYCLASGSFGGCHMQNWNPCYDYHHTCDKIENHWFSWNWNRSVATNKILKRHESLLLVSLRLLMVLLHVIFLSTFLVVCLKKIWLQMFAPCKLQLFESATMYELVFMTVRLIVVF